MDLILNLVQEHIFHWLMFRHQCSLKVSQWIQSYCNTVMSFVRESGNLQSVFSPLWIPYPLPRTRWQAAGIPILLPLASFDQHTHPSLFSPQASFSPQNSVFLFTLFDQTSAFFTFTLETFYQNTLSFLPIFTLRLWTNAPLHPFLQKCWCSKWSKTCILPN